MMHIYPVDDLREHVVEGTKCWCKPQIDEEYDVLIHNALDGREQYETGERKLN